MHVSEAQLGNKMLYGRLQKRVPGWENKSFEEISFHIRYFVLNTLWFIDPVVDIIGRFLSWFLSHVFRFWFGNLFERYFSRHHWVKWIGLFQPCICFLTKRLFHSHLFSIFYSRQGTLHFRENIIEFEISISNNFVTFYSFLPAVDWATLYGMYWYPTGWLNVYPKWNFRFSNYDYILSVSKLCQQKNNYFWDCVVIRARSEKVD